MKYQVTGNEYVSLPTIRESDGAIESISCLYMNLKGMIELKGRNGLIRPFLQYDEKEIVLSPVWSRNGLAGISFDFVGYLLLIIYFELQYKLYCNSRHICV